MDILVNVANQKLKIATNLKSLVAGTQEFVRFVFNLTSDWDDLMTFAQFMQDGVAYNQYLDEDNSAYLPAEIGPGTCTLMLYGSDSDTIATTNYLTISLDENILVNDAQSTEISTSLYNQLVTRVNTLITFNQQSASELSAVDRDLQIQINAKAAADDLTREIARAKAAEQANATNIALKANQSQVDELAIQVTQLENNEVVSQLIEEAVQSELEAYLDAGSLASMTIGDGTIARSKVNSAFEQTLRKADTAMQPSTYDTQGLGVDVYAYAQSRADTVQNNLNDTKTEIAGAYRLSDTVVYQNLGDAVRGAVTMANTYSQALLAGYKAFHIEIVDQLPVVGESLTFYLVPKSDGSGYEKYWWITDETGDSIWDAFGSSTTLVVNALPEVGDPDLDYVLKTNAGCLYYKYIDGYWEVVAGSVADVVSTLPSTGNEFTDYYVLSENGVYVHYRWINNAFHAIGTETYSRDEINTLISTALDPVEERVTDVESAVSAVQVALNRYGNAVSDVTKISSGIRITYIDGSTKDITIDSGTDLKDVTYDAEHYLHFLDSNDNDLFEPILIVGGGGSGQTSTGTATIQRTTASSVDCIYGDTTNIQFVFTATDSSGDTVGSGTGTWTIGGVTVATSEVRQGSNSFDIGPYLYSGANNVRLSVSVDTGGDTPMVTTKTWTVNAVNLYFDWPYDDAQINTSAVTDRWTPYGDVSKVTHTKLDGVELETSTTSRTGVQQSILIPMQTHGAHGVERWITATIGQTSVRTQSQYHEMIFAVSGNTTPIVAISMTDFDIMQYNAIRIPVMVYDPASLTATATLKVDGTTVATWTDVDRSVHYWTYTPTTSGAHTLSVTCGATTKSITATVEAVEIDAEEISGYTFRFKASDFATNSAVQSWDSEGITASFSNNFDWINGGLQTETDESGSLQQYFCIKAGTTMTINYPLFSVDPRVNGMNYKMIFKVANCRDYDAQIAHCYADNVGIRMYAHQAQFNSSNTTVSVPYGEDEYIELEFDVYPAPRQDNDGNYRYMMAWIDGVITSTRVYGATDNFVQSVLNRENIVIGSADCDVYVYMVKSYQALITRDNHIDNFITDAPNALEMVKRYNRNDILDNTGEISYEKLRDNNPDCRIWLYDIPYMTVGKKDKVANCKFNQFWKNGDKYYELVGTGTMTVQGTSSVDYLRGAANTDISFTELRDGNGNDLLANGVVDADYGNNYFESDGNGAVKVYMVTEDTELTSECIPVERDASGNVTKYIRALGYKVNDDSTPISYSNTKVNFASCEQVNNMCNAIWYQRFNPYPSLTPRDCMEFSMGVQFIKDSGTVPDDDHFVLYGDNKYHMYSIGNMGTSKKNVHVFHDMSNSLDCCIEVNNNLNDLCRMITIDGYDDIDWTGKVDGRDHSFGMRYPDVSDPSAAVKNGWKRFVQWMAENNPNAATNETLATPETYGTYTFRGHSRAGTQVLRGTTVTQYAGTYTTDSFNRRIAKMLSECEDYMVMDSVVYHFVYLERHTMVDNVAKNSFWASSDLIHWDLSKAYDMDTSDGNNNEGQMVFDYGNEYDDTIGTKTVFNAADSVWFVFIANLYEACQTMFTNREAAGAWSASAYHQFFLSEQQKVPERVWVQCYWYDYLRTYERGINGAWMSFLDGGQKTHQRRHYETFEEPYDSSKYRGTSCTSRNVTLRGYTPTAGNWAGVEPKNEITIKMYNKMYIVVSIDGNYRSQKAVKGQTYTINFDDVGTLNDTVINLYTAHMIQEIGDIAPLYPGFCSFSNATRLRSLHVGSNVTGYSNTNLESLEFGNNRMLEYLYAQNLPNASSNLDLSNCPALLYLDASGSAFTGYDFAVGGLLHTAYINRPTSLSMRDLAYIEDANFSVADYTALGTLRLENCPGIDSLAIVNNASSLLVVRLLGIDWEIPSTDVLDRVYYLAGIDEAGWATSKAVLTGLAYVPTMRQSKLSMYNTAWPNLAITYTSMTTQYLATFVNADGSPIIDKRTGEAYTQWVDRGDNPYDPITVGEVDTPTQVATAQYTFAFSGWDGMTDAVLSNVTITATYTETVRSYTVRWFAQVGSLLETQTVNYGDEVTYSNGIPTLSDEESSYVYKVFAGWNKSTGFIREDTDVYAIWDRAELPALGRDLSTMTAGEVYAVASSGRANAYFEAKDHIDVTLGHDFSFTNVESRTLISSETYFDGTTVQNTGITLFGENDPSFTLAIDFRFNSTTSNNTLASCFVSNGNEGFRLRYSSAPEIQWGDKSQVVGSINSGTHYRDIVVLRHRAGENRMYVYHGQGTSGRFAPTLTSTQLIRTRETTTDTPLVLGAVRFSDGGYDYYGTGTIYWAKIWFDDLGDTNARKLAAWRHEPMRFEFCGKDRYRIAGGTSLKSNASFIANNELEGYGYWMNSSNINAGGWNASLMRTFCNGRLFDAMPTVWQSMIKTVEINASAGDKSTEILTSEDKIYLACERELQPSETNSTYVLEGDPITWFTSQARKVKFRGRIIGDNAQYFSGDTDPTAITTNNVNYGDIWIHTGNSSIGYILVPSDELTRLGISPAYNASTGGGWVGAHSWWLRSPYLGTTTYFWFVTIIGYVYYNSNASTVIGVVPCFSI